MKGSVAVRHLGLGQGLHHHDTHFPATPMAVDSLHHHHANNHNSHQHMARVKAGVAARTSASSFASSSAGAAADSRHTSSSATSSSGGGTRPPSTERLATPSVSERLTPRRFLDKYSLPRVVRVVADGGRAKQPMSGPLAQPLLLYRHYTSCKVLARSLRRPGDKAAKHRDDKHGQHGQHEAGTGPPLVIPDSYQGWFSLVRERSLQTRAKLYTSIQQLVNARVAVFLSKGSLSGFKLAHAPSPGVDGDMASMGLSGRRLQYARSTVRGGQVLRLLAVFEDNETGNASARSRRGQNGSLGLGGLGVLAPRGPGSGSGLGSGLGRALPAPLGRMASTPTQYAQCLTARNESVFVPVSATGSFYAVATEDAAERDADGDVDDDLSRVYQLPQLLRLTAEPLPVKVQLVCGPIQSPLPTGFTGLLLLEDLQQEDVILACTIPRSWALPCATPTAPSSGTPGGDNPAPSQTSPTTNTTATSSSTTTTSSSSSSASSTAAEEGDTSSKPVFLEMDADSKFLLTRPLASREAEARFFKTPLLRRVLSHCRERADLWSSQIKVTHHVFPFPDNSGGPALVAAAPKAASVVVASAAAAPAASTRSPSEHGSSGRAGLFRVGAAKERDASALGGRASSLSSGGTKKSQSFRYASSSQAALAGGGGKPLPGAGAGATAATPATPSTPSTRGTHRGTQLLLQQLQSLPGLKNLLRRTSSVSPSASSQPPDVPLSVVFPELFGLPPPSASTEDGAGGGPSGQEGVGAAKHAVRAVQQLCFYADELPYGRVADALPSALPTALPSASQAAAKQPPRPRAERTAVSSRGLPPRGRALYDEAEEGDEEDEDDAEDDDHRDRRQRRIQRHGHDDDDEENIYAEICECPRRGHGRAPGVVVSGAKVILTTACSEERRGYYTFASATSKDQYYTGGSDGTFSGTMSSSNPSNPEEDLYDNVC